MTHVQPLNPDRVWRSLSVALVDDPGMTELNRSFRQKERTTDVLSFPYPPLPGEHAHGWSGEVIINVQLAHREGTRRHNVDHELALYLAHGCQHLAGETDDTPADRQRMRRRELRWLKKAEPEELTQNLIKA